MVRSWPAPSSPGTTAMALPSMGTTAMRWFTNRPRTTTSASASGWFPGGSCRPAARLPGTSSNCRGAPSASAASGSVTTPSGS